jgi:hypothetical protein
MMLQKDCLTGKSFVDEGEESIIKRRIDRYVELLQSRKLAQLLHQHGRLFDLKPCS